MWREYRNLHGARTVLDALVPQCSSTVCPAAIVWVTPDAQRKPCPQAQEGVMSDYWWCKVPTTQPQDLSSDPQKPCKEPGMVVCGCILSTRRWTQQDPEVHWSRSLAKSPCSRYSERLCLKNEMEKDVGRYSRSNSASDTYAYTHTDRHTAYRHTHTHNSQTYMQIHTYAYTHIQHTDTYINTHIYTNTYINTYIYRHTQTHDTQTHTNTHIHRHTTHRHE